MTLKSIERHLASHSIPYNYPWVTDMICDIEAEIAERYMPLPVDADGIPIRVGDKMRARDWCEDRRVDSYAVVCRTSDGYRVWHYADELTHVNERTIEDVLRDLVDGIDSIEFDALTEIDRAAAEIRDLLGDGKVADLTAELEKRDKGIERLKKRRDELQAELDSMKAVGA